MYENIKTYFEEKKIPKFRSKQFENAIFKQFISSFDEITVFPKHLREELEKNCELHSLELIHTHDAKDTTKFLLKTKDNNFIESVLMYHKDGRRTLCVSSQIFCALGCTFCATGANQYKRNLTTEEIVQQAIFVSKLLKKNDERITNVVYMGMGEPFLNYENVVESIKIFNDEKYFNIGARHITVSTAGIIPQIYEFTKLGLQVRLAISLHAANEKLRSMLMPINDKYSLKELIEATDNFTTKTNKRVTFEYVLIKDINDQISNAKELAQLLRGKLAFVNLLVYNPHEFAKFEKPTLEIVKKFKETLENEGIECAIRRSMGDDISGACGQLSGKEKKKNQP
jgi:23S rRNA (adenine2503-C2)-methyltransferase